METEGAIFSYSDFFFFSSLGSISRCIQLGSPKPSGWVPKFAVDLGKPSATQ